MLRLDCGEPTIPTALVSRRRRRQDLYEIRGRILDIYKVSVSFVGQENRIKLIVSLVRLISLSKSIPLCRYILDMVRDRTLDRRDAYPTMKEKAMFLTRMVTFESRPDAVEPFHGLIYDIYTSPALRRSELRTRLEICFLVGCRAKDVTIQENFIGLLDISVPRSLSNRQTYILGVQSWEALNGHNWIFLTLHLLFGTLDGEQSLVPNSQASFIRNSSAFPPRVIASNLIRPIQRISFLDPQTSHEIWAATQDMDHASMLAPPRSLASMLNPQSSKSKTSLAVATSSFLSG